MIVVAAWVAISITSAAVIAVAIIRAERDHQREQVAATATAADVARCRAHHPAHTDSPVDLEAAWRAEFTDTDIEHLPDHVRRELLA